MLPVAVIDAAVRTLAEAARPQGIVLFGSHARGQAGPDSDLDLLVIEEHMDDRAAEMVRLRRALRYLRISVDVLVASADEVAQYAVQPGHVLYWALKEGRVVYGRA
jgi:predicted nucleotidyltransferase